MTIDQAKTDLHTANRAIIKRHRYACGLMGEQKYDSPIKADKAEFFFESPDGQNAELYTELRNLGYGEQFYKAPYHWRVAKQDVEIEYVEGDIYITLHSVK